MIHYIALTGTDTELSKTIDGKVRAIWVFLLSPPFLLLNPVQGLKMAALAAEI
jgi:hypothetical protein